MLPFIRISSLLLSTFGCTFVLQAKPKTFKVFLLAGQSNMQGQGVVDMDHPKYYNSGKGNLVNTMSDP